MFLANARTQASVAAEGPPARSTPVVASPSNRSNSGWR